MEFKIDGDEELKRAFDQVPEKVYKKHARLSTAKGGRIVRKKMKAEAPKETGVLQKSLASKVKTYKQSGNIVAIIGPRADVVGIVTRPDGKVERRVPRNYAHLVELGTDHSPANPFMRRSFNSSAEEASKAIINGIWDGIEIEASKAPKGR